MRQLSRRVATAGALVALAFAGSAVTAQATEMTGQVTAAADKKFYGCGWDRNKCVRGRDTLTGLGYSTTVISDNRHCTAPGCYNGFYFHYWK